MQAEVSDDVIEDLEDFDLMDHIVQEYTSAKRQEVGGILFMYALYLHHSPEKKLCGCIGSTTFLLHGAVRW